MSLNELLSVEDLVSQMGSAPRTSGWDVVVSYKVKELNDLLLKVWKNKDNSEQPVEPFVTKKYEKRRHKECLHSVTTWSVKIQPPVLQFTANRAVLKSDITGTVSVQYYSGDVPGEEKKDGEPEVDDIGAGWVMTVKVPMSSVSVNDDQIQTQRSQGEILDFSSDPTHKGHIVFDFELSDDFEVTFDYTGPGDDDPDEDQPDPNMDQVKRWFKNNVKAIDFSLASVTQDQDPKTAYLTPQQMAFQLYHPVKPNPDTDLSIACLSVYIKTKESGPGNGIGDRVPEFSGTKGNMYPIPKGHTTSIIINKEAIWDRLLLPKLQTIANSHGTNAFRAFSDESKYIKTGLQLKMKWDTTYPWQDAKDGLGDDLIGGWWDYDPGPRIMANGSMSEDMKSYLESAEGPVLTIKDTGDIVFDSNFTDVSVRTFMYKAWIRSGGTVMYGVKANASRNILADDEQIEAQISVSESDWKPNIYGGDARGDMRDDHIKWLKRFVWPTFNISVKLNFFATTNVFAPGKHIIKVDRNVGIRVPYDFLLVGDLVNPED